jgi:uncharacterized delta-60 repeat protein
VANDVAERPDGTLLLAGSIAGKVAVVRLLPDGKLDTTFKGTGIAATTIDGAAAAMTVDGDGRILLAVILDAYGSPNARRAAVVRLNKDGNLDSTFGQAGIAEIETQLTTDFASSIFLQPDGRIVVGGGAGNPPTVFFARLWN